MLNRRSDRWIQALTVAVALALAACGETGVTDVSQDGLGDLAPALITLPTVPDDGLTARDISGVTATDFVTAGAGTASNDPEEITVDVPAGATVTAVFLYWARRISDPNDAPPSEIMVEGSTVGGDVIGGPIEVPQQDPVSYRADITSSGVVSPGTSTFEVEDDAEGALGASVVVFFEETASPAVLRLWDGIDYLWAGLSTEPLTTAEPVTFTFPASSSPRSARLDLFIGDIEPADASDRPNSLEITVGTETIVLGSAAGDEPVFQAFQGAEWDNFSITITIPAGVDEVTVEPISGPENSVSPASLVWVAAGLSIQPAGGGEGCTPGFWRQPHHFDSWTTYSPGDALDDDDGGPFDVPNTLQLARPERGNASDLTLGEAIELRGGGVNALIRHAVAALLNAASPDVDYDLTVAEVIEKFNAAVGPGGDIEGTKDEFEGFNEQTCPLD